MPHVQELVLQEPDMMHSHFYIKKESTLYQTWEDIITIDTVLQFYYEPENIWLTGTVASWFIDDSSGNAPDVNAHYFVTIERDGTTYKYDLHNGLRIRVEVPTDEELMKRPTWCESGEWIAEYNQPDTFVHCYNHGTRYVTSHGHVVWYCDDHKPTWIAIAS